ncbi:2-amino-4-hydroxy-6-hydroxymethyldihydropteridine diphosphokinase [Roseobacter ponti]|uniref:2-amino-4-hydroxy-6-hydroxymethyldihydropteridine pyrophosphokinase n=1 Tax=Roseobacter ponti TaxID=1891787 RepID=A0A858SWF6_9RHOB|nr:2-amino-4-hydroxy-6-hydroxymethyldihydropteridine diphosphokinase [Roseobacter ponti]QJF53074.1 2-amino-4-hydroxy-6-hydroxymethyldihydropteridine diphosphokinase [Roseobacter ponti]
MPQIRSVVLVALGSNRPSAWGDPRETLQRAVSQVGSKIGVIRALSGLYRTPAFPAGSGPDFVNAALAAETALSPGEVLSALHAIEADAGRERNVRWSARGLDLDLIAAGDLVLPDPETHEEWRDLTLEDQMKRVPETLILPHPRMQERAFVLVPLCDVAPDWVHPVSGRSVSEMCAGLPQGALDEVQKLHSALVKPQKGA